MASTRQTLDVKGTPVQVVAHNEEDYLSLTDMTAAFEGGVALIEQWLRNKNTLEFLATWERLYNPAFNSLEFEGIKTEAGLNRFFMSVKKWTNTTQAVGIQAHAGRYGGTYAHVDIAFEFGSWLSAEFKLYLIREFKRLKEAEIERQTPEWNLRRSLVKLNYRIQTHAIQQKLIPPRLDPKKAGFIYATEADVLNVALFGKTAKQWREENPTLQGNVRDHATAIQLLVLANLENLNAYLITRGLDQHNRAAQLNSEAIHQLHLLLPEVARRQLPDSKD